MTEAKKAVLSVEGMTCASCVRHIDRALRQLEGVTLVDVDMRGQKVTVRHDESETPLALVVEALAEAGYPACSAAP
jgi:copper ion binding protein